MSSSAITKRAIASAFEELLEVTPLEQITVSAIAERTGINRQTFYYHFHDIHELIIWIYRNGIEQALSSTESSGDMHTALLACLRGLKAKRDFVVRTAHGFGTPYAYRFAYDEVKASLTARWRVRSGASPGTPMVRRRTHPTSSTVRS